MPTIGVYFSEVEYSKLVSLVNENEKISEHIRSVVLADLSRSTKKKQAPITVGS